METSFTEADDPWRELLARAAEEIDGGYRAVAESAGVGGTPDSGRVTLLAWVNGRKNRRGKRCYPKLSKKNRTAILDFLEERYPNESRKIRREHDRVESSRLAAKLPRSRTKSPREVFAKALAEMGVSGISSSEIRAGFGIQQVYAPEEGLTVEDLEYFGPLLDEDDKEELARAVEANARAWRLLRLRRSKKEGDR